MSDSEQRGHSRSPSDNKDINLSDVGKELETRHRDRLKQYKTASPNSEVGRQSQAKAHQFDLNVPHPHTASNTPNMVVHGRSNLHANQRFFSSFLEVPYSYEEGYRLFSPLTATFDPTFSEKGDVLKEALRIFEILRNNLRTFGQDLNSIVHISALLRNPEDTSYLDEVISLLFRAYVPHVSVNIADALPDECSIEIQVSSLWPEENTLLTLPQTQRKYSDNLSLGNGSSTVRRHPSQEHTLPNANVNVLPSFEYSQGHSPSAFGDILPTLLAQAFGFYGEPGEVVKASMRVLNSVRVFLFLTSPISYSSIFVSEVFKNDLRLEDLNPPIFYFLTISIAVSLQNFLLLCYGFTWLYFNAQCLEPGKIFLSDVPSWVLTKFSWYCVLSYFGDALLIVFLLSSCSTLTSTIMILDVNEDRTIRKWFIIADCLGFFQLCIYLFIFPVSRRLRRTLRDMNYSLPISSGEPIQHMSTPQSSQAPIQQQKAANGELLKGKSNSGSNVSFQNGTPVINTPNLNNHLYRYTSRGAGSFQNSSNNINYPQRKFSSAMSRNTGTQESETNTPEVSKQMSPV